MAATAQPGIAEKDSIRPRALPSDLDANRTLEEITCNAQHATGASGAALVLSDGKDMSCRACSGELAPPVGTRLNPDAGFTATCVRTGEVIACDDTMHDPRIHGSGCSELGIRSILAVPVFDGSKVAGVLEVLSSEPKKFGERHVTALKLLARLVETVVNYASRRDNLVEAQTSEAKTQAIDSNRASAETARVMCLSCGHRNPQGSQFCNRCGVILLVSLGQSETAQDPGKPGGLDSNADEGLKEVYRLISESADGATWNEIYTRLTASLQSLSAQPQAGTAAKPAPAKATEGEEVSGLGRTRGANELKTRLGAAVRRSLWL